MSDRPEKKSIDQLLELYCDDQLSSAERAEFEQAIADDPSLLAHVELQSKIDSSLRTVFGETHVAVSSKSIGSGKSSQWTLRVAAALMFALSAGVIYWQYRGEADNDSNTIQARTMQGYYDEAVAAGFEPGWACSGEQFTSTFESRFGGRLVIGELPEGVALSGLGYAQIKSGQTVVVFASVGDEPVLLFVGPGSATVGVSPVSQGMYRHEQEIGRMRIYEVSSISTPRILPHLSLDEVQ